MKPTELLHPTQKLPSKAYLVNELRKAVFARREPDFVILTKENGHLIVETKGRKDGCGC